MVQQSAQKKLKSEKLTTDNVFVEFHCDILEQT